MSGRASLILLTLLLAGCASGPPVPVGDSRVPSRVEPALPGAGAPTGQKLYTVKKGDTLLSIALDHGVDHRELAAWNNIDNPNRIAVGRQLRVTPPQSAAPAAADAPIEVRPIAGSGAVVSRPLDEASAAVPPAPTSANTERMKREPRGGKLPYSEENLAQLKAREAAPVAVASPPAVQAVAAAPAEKPAGGSAAAAVAESSGIEWSWPAGGKVLANFSESGSGQELNKGVDIAGKIGDPVLAAAAGKVIYVGVFPKHGNLAVVLHGGGYSSVYAHNSRILVKEGQQVTRGQKIAELGDSDADQPKLHFEVRQQGKPVDPFKFLPAR